MMTNNISKNKARLMVLSIFVIGFTAGALSMNLYQRLYPATPPKSGKPQEVIIKKMDTRLSLNAEQEARIKSILDETFEQYGEVRKEMEPKFKEYEPRFKEIRQKSRDRIRAELTDKQLPEFEKMIEEDDKRREEERQKH
ncbi:MAG: hypothetical protein HY231_12585 [Acidobacteria bacterium]|nr:hypothetical protein [Acidobacteriota bacterium]